ncbi:MAG TPA: OB-fold nucleic acid binding domain-containing protein [Acidimicrobiales bacterium]|nr:OB-fold nucleic acid binding domain-containing protein [Acidimicrobiales bacterium]
MALRDLLHKLTASTEVLHEEQLREFAAKHAGVQPIAEVTPRTQTSVVGEIASVRIVPRPDGSPWLEATITDGTGRIVALWTGRRRIAGIASGQRLVISGRPSPTGPGGRLLIYNPYYELL